MKIGIDLDCTLNCLDAIWDSWIKDRDPAFDPNEPRSWDIHKHTVIGERCYEFLRIPSIFRNLPAREGAVENTKILTDRGHELYVVSASIPDCWKDKCDWIAEHFPHIPQRRYIATETKSILKLDLLIDDGAHNLFAFGNSGIAYDRPWNKEWQGLRVSHWDEVPALIGRIG
jgi:5'(3')-deoxyribonucleotidase